MELTHTPNIFVGVIDHLNPVAQAMMIAMYSRSYGSIMDRLPKNEEEELSLMKRLETYYVGYGHKSVGQLGHTTVFLEGVSQLAAKAIEDDPLFDGQESSTRYIDYSTQPMIISPNHVDYDKQIRYFQEEFRKLYIAAMPLVRERLSKEYPYEELPDSEYALTEEEVKAEKKRHTTWVNTINARAFDICRGLLPAGSATNVAFTGSFDVLNEHFAKMLFHPLVEMRGIAQRVLTGLRQKYPHATPALADLQQRHSYVARNPMTYFYPMVAQQPHLRVLIDGSDGHYLNPLLAQREKWDNMPRHISEAWRFRLGGKLDFGAFRDLHRHRNGVILMPLLTPELGFDPWYLKELPADIATAAVALLNKLENAIPSLFQMQAHLQYAVPMGARVPVHYECGFNQLAYLLELRSGKTVHQTLRNWTHQVYDDMDHTEASKPLKAKIYPDLDKDNFTLKRGTQTFSGEFK